MYGRRAAMLMLLDLGQGAPVKIKAGQEVLRSMIRRAPASKESKENTS